jgi:hypothetical protein
MFAGHPWHLHPPSNKITSQIRFQIAGMITIGCRRNGIAMFVEQSILRSRAAASFDDTWALNPLWIFS